GRSGGKDLDPRHVRPDASAARLAASWGAPVRSQGPPLHPSAPSPGRSNDDVATVSLRVLVVQENSLGLIERTLPQSRAGIPCPRPLYALCLTYLYCSRIRDSMNRLDTEARARVVALLCEGMAVRPIVRATGIAKNTVQSLI